MIEFNCHCGQRLQVPDAHAGKIARCPKCGSERPIPSTGAADAGPFEANSPFAAPPFAEPAGDPPSLGQREWGQNPFGPSSGSSGSGSTGSSARDSVTSEWYIKTPDGERHGPLPENDLEYWRTSGRLNHECQLLQNGWQQWKWADEVFPELAAPRRESGPAPAAPRPSDSDNPYAASTLRESHALQREPGYSDHRYIKPHRGGLILSMSLGSFFLDVLVCLCCIPFGLALSVPAWVMAQNDLREMQLGQMDPSGEGTTRAGWILAIVNVILTALLFVFTAVVTAFRIAADPNF